MEEVIRMLVIVITRELMRGISCVDDFISNCSSIEERHVFQVLFSFINTMKWLNDRNDKRREDLGRKKLEFRKSWWNDC